MSITRTLIAVPLVLAAHALVLTAGQAPPAAQQPAAPAPAAAGLDYEMFKSQIQPMFIKKREGLVRCVQCHGRGGGTGGLLVIPPDEGTTAWTEEQSRKNFDSASRLVGPGQPRGQPAADAPARHATPAAIRSTAAASTGRPGRIRSGRRWRGGRIRVASTTYRGLGRLRRVSHEDRTDLPARARGPDGPGVVRRVSLGHRHAAEAAAAAGRPGVGRWSSRGRTSRPPRS